MSEYHPEDDNLVYDYGPEKPKRGHGLKSKWGKDEDFDGRIIGGMILVGIGVMLFLQALGFLPDDFSWWTFFLIVPGLALIVSSIGAYLNTGQWNEDIGGKSFGGVMLLFIGAIFLFDLSWGLVWPFFLILPGIALLIGWIGNEEDDEE